MKLRSRRWHRIVAQLMKFHVVRAHRLKIMRRPIHPHAVGKTKVTANTLVVRHLLRFNHHYCYSILLHVLIFMHIRLDCMSYIFAI